MQKQNKAKRIISLILLLAMIITMLSVTTVSAFAAEDGVAGFVQRCYQVTLNREPDETGYADWTSKLTNGEMDGATVAWGFVFSDEYTNANKDNGAFVTDMYTLFLDRTPDEEGYNDWVGKMEAGADRQEIFYGFANSVEFFNICTDYGVTAGYFTTEFNKDQVNAVNMFVARMYRICFGRLGDQGGQADWTSKLLRGELTGIDCAAGFINSNEYQNLNLSNEDYIRNMYRTFLGREADEEGFNGWVSQLENGNTRDEIFAGFANSTEFQSICDGYGIVRGDYTAQDVHQARQRVKIMKTSYTIDGKPSFNGPVIDEYTYFPGTNIVQKQTRANVGERVFDKEGQLLEEYTHNRLTRKLTNVSDTHYDYENYSYDGLTGTMTSLTTEEYDKLQDGKFYLSKETIKDLQNEGNGWINTYTYEFDANGLLYKSVRIPCDLQGNPWVGDMETTYKYDEQNRLIEKTEKSLDTVYEAHEYYQYGDNGKISKKICAYDDGDQHDHQYIYDANGILVKEIGMQDLEGGGRVLDYDYSKYTYEYTYEYEEY